MKNQITTNSTRLRLLVLCVSLLFVACVSLVSSAEAGRMRQAVQQTPPAEKTVEQVQKNIKVLTGLPQSQLIPAMNFMSASLGVRCNYCHVNKDGKWDFVSDEKPEKATAREMIKMVLNVNKTTFKGNPSVSCYTCHRGRTSPVGVPPLPLPEATPAPVQGETKPKEELPTVDQILAK
jgi:photosynthetic reaction center cytochrome c subunit